MTDELFSILHLTDFYIRYNYLLFVYMFRTYISVLYYVRYINIKVNSFLLSRNYYNRTINN